MYFDLDQIDPKIGYKLMSSTVTPRPIAWVTTLTPQGSVNAAPYSFFNVMGHTPPTLVLGLLADPERGFKDTAANILDGGEFVVNLVSEAQAPQMNITTMDAPRGFSELEAAGLTPLASRHVEPPQIAEAPVSFECRSLSTIVTGPHQTIAVGHILSIRIDDAYVQDAERGYVDTPAMQLIARMHGSGWYARSTDLFQMARPSFADWQAERVSDSVDCNTR